MKNNVYLLLTTLFLLPASAQAIDEKEVREILHTVFGLYLTPFEAYNMKKNEGNKVLFIDVRARPELKYVGASQLIDANIPSRFINTDFSWSNKVKSYRTSKNFHFIEDFEKLLADKNLNKETPIILICQSGSRVPKAAKQLHEAGFAKVYSQYQGFEGIKAKSGINKDQRVVNGWKNAGLPWSYRLKKEAMYFNFNSSQPQATD